ncbi:hypothetical protein CYMTET_3320 [Cymbomonas tetramitiformis]|uniref:Uncharacterized protein n=1 Tax=Cymbomonas tetramitiformis TaxID=36881 RepID=A0AAE0H3J1_9CHLO|nr:hypothetical protein CYMTET_3320 [Cymbomonas tetramitiformis]
MAASWGGRRGNLVARYSDYASTGLACGSRGAHCLVARSPWQPRGAVAVAASERGRRGRDGLGAAAAEGASRRGATRALPKASAFKQRLPGLAGVDPHQASRTGTIDGPTGGMSLDAAMALPADVVIAEYGEAGGDVGD